MALRLVKALPILLAALSLAACVESRVMSLAPAPAQLFNSEVHVETVGTHRVTDRHGHVIAGSGEGAARGFASGFGGSVGAGLDASFSSASAGAGGLIVGILLAPVVGLGGSMYGAAAAHPEEETEAAIAAMERVYSDDALLEGIAAKVRRDIPSLGFRAAPSCPEDAASGCAMAPRNRLSLDATYAFSTVGEYSPLLHFAIDVTVTATGPETGETAFRWSYLSHPGDFFTVTADDAAGLRAVLGKAQENLARRIVEDLFVRPNEARVAGTYFPGKGQGRFTPEPLAPGSLARLPTDQQLSGAPDGAFID